MRDRPNSSSLRVCDQVCDQVRADLDSIMEFGLNCNCSMTNVTVVVKLLADIGLITITEFAGLSICKLNCN